MLPFHKQLLAGVIAGSLLMTTAAPVLAKPRGDDHPGRGRAQERFEFEDWQEDYWANESLSRLILKGVILGDNGTLAPQRTVTKLEAAIMLVRLLGLEPVAREGKWSGRVPGGKWEFKVDGEEIKYEFKYRGEQFEFKWDDEGLKIEGKGPQGKIEWHIRDGSLVPDWGRGYVQVALAQGFLVPDGNALNILSPLNRLDATVMLVRAAGLEEAARAKAGADLTFTDEEAIPAAFRGYVALAVENGLISGYPDGSFRPDALVTRAEWAALLDRFDRRAEDPVDEHQVQGVLLAVNTGSQASITIATEQNPSGQTYTVAADVLVFADGREATLADLEPGDQVIAQLNSSGAVTFLVRTGHQAPVEDRVEGEVVALGQSQIVLRVEGDLETYPLAGNFTVYAGNTRIRYSDLRVGDLLEVTLVEGEAVRLERIEAAQEQVEGKVVGLGTDRLVLDVDGSLKVYELATGFTVYEGNTRIRYSDLQVGDTLRLTLTDGKAVRLERLNAQLETERSGRIESLSQSQGTLRLDGDDSQTPDRFTVSFASDAEVVFKDLKLPAEVLAVGQRLLVAGEWEGSELVADSLALDPERSTVTFGASLADRDTESDGDPESIRVTVGNRTTLLPVTAAVQVTLGGQRIPFTDLQPGDQVRVTWNRNAVTTVVVQERSEVSLTGRIDALDSARKSFRFSYEDGSTRRSVMADWDTETTVEFQGLMLSTAALAVGQELTLTGRLQDGRVQAEAIELDPESRVEFAAKVRSTGSDDLTVQVGRETATLPVAGNLQVTIAGIPVALAELETGDGVSLKVAAGEVTEVTVTDRAEFAFGGELIRLNLSDLNLRVRHLPEGANRSVDIPVTLTAATRIEYQGLLVTPAALQLGQELEIEGELEAGTVTAERVEILSLGN